ncbi:MAG: signal recognition particle protein [Lentisphaeria bacterium]|nr:signal recognition particle protein [Lentisphaeria bacterium]
MFDNLTGKLQDALKRLRGQAVLSEANIAEAMKEIREALLDADVNLEIADEFIADVQRACLGSDVLRSVTPGQQVVKVVYDKMVEFMGEADAPLASGGKPTVVMMVGLHGSGKTTTTAKLAIHLKNKNKKVLMTACDIYRPAAIDQLEILGRENAVAVHAERGNPDVCSIASNAIAEAREKGFDYVLLDTAGRLQIDVPMVQELVRLKQTSGAQEVLLVADAALGQQAVSVASHFHDALTLTGIVLTKLDGDARGGAAFSIRKVTGCPIKFVGVGEKMENLDIFHPDRMAGRILGMGDIVSLVEQAAEKFDREETEKLQQKLRKNEFDLNDFLGQLRQMSKLGGIEGILKFLPGGNKLAELPDLDPKQFKRMEAIISSMTKKERANVEMIDMSRRKRIAKGCGCSLEEVSRLIKQFSTMRNMMKRGGMLSRMASGGGMPSMGLGMPGFRPPSLRGSNYTPPKKKRKKHK